MLAIFLSVVFAVLAQSSAGTNVTECKDLAVKLQTCAPYTCTFVHPFTNETMQRRITGLNNGNCVYTEDMPAGGKMQCAYPAPMRQAVAQYLKDVQAAAAAGKSTSTQVTADLGSGKAQTKYTIDGKAVDNPLQTALDSGACKITGYDRR